MIDNNNNNNNNNKILIYTISSNDTTAFSCADLLYKSLKTFLTDKFDFQVVVPTSSAYDPPESISPFIFIADTTFYRNQHIFTLKYHPQIFNQPYNYFIYLDSDILWTITKLYNIEYNCLCFENCAMKHRVFSKIWPGPKNRNDLKQIRGINAGFFGLHKDISLQLSDFMTTNLFHRKKSKGLLEQNFFNYFIYTYFLKSEPKNFLDISHKFVLGARPEFVYQPDMAYHFYGDMCNMQIKLERMNQFLTNNNLII